MPEAPGITAYRRIGIVLAHHHLEIGISVGARTRVGPRVQGRQSVRRNGDTKLVAIYRQRCNFLIHLWGVVNGVDRAQGGLDRVVHLCIKLGSAVAGDADDDLAELVAVGPAGITSIEFRIPPVATAQQLCVQLLVNPSSTSGNAQGPTRDQSTHAPMVRFCFSHWMLLHVGSPSRTGRTLGHFPTAISAMLTFEGLPGP